MFDGREAPTGVCAGTVRSTGCPTAMALRGNWRCECIRTNLLITIKINVLYVRLLCSYLGFQELRKWQMSVQKRSTAMSKREVCMQQELLEKRSACVERCLLK